MAALGIIVGLLPGFAWLLFYLQEEVHPEPRKLIVRAFLNGAAFAFVAFFLQQFLNTLIGPLGWGKFSIQVLIAFAFTEELVKFFAAYAAIHRSSHVHEPVDAMIYMVVAAMGFATIENIGVLTTTASVTPETALLANIFHVLAFRFAGATLLHALTSALLGYHWALGMKRGHAARSVFFGLIAATLLHATFNWLILSYGEQGIALIFLILIGLYVLIDFEKLKKTVV